MKHDPNQPEVERLREALQRIARNPMGISSYIAYRECQEFANAALENRPFDRGNVK